MKNLLKTSFVLCMLAISNTAIARHPIPCTEKRLQIGAFINPEYISTSLFDYGFKPAAGYAKNVYAFSAGSILRYKHSNRLSLTTGLGLGFRKAKDIGPFFSNPNKPDTTEGWNCLPQDLSTSSSAFALELQVPLNIQYYIVNDRLYLSPGAEFNYGLYNKVKATFDNPSDVYQKSASFSGMDVAINFGIGYQFNRFKRHPITLEPSVKIYTATGQLYGTDMIFGLKTTVFFRR